MPGLLDVPQLRECRIAEFSVEWIAAIRRKYLLPVLQSSKAEVPG